MTKFKVGDIVKHRTARDAFRNGQPARVVEIENGRWDVVAEIIDGPNAGTKGYGPFENWELVAPAIDWTKPIEAVHEDGRVVAVKLDRIDPDGEHILTEPLHRDPNQGWYFRADGTQEYDLSDIHGGGKPWRIRNVLNEMSEANDELAQLRAFRDAAVAKYPDLDVKPETDEDAASRIARFHGFCSNGLGFDCAMDAIAWARANPPKG